MQRDDDTPVGTLDLGRGRAFGFVDLAGALGPALPRLPYVLRIVAENILRQRLGRDGPPDATVEAFRRWPAEGAEIIAPLRVSRVILPDSSGLPALMDLAAARDAARQRGLPATAIEPSLPVTLVIDHSLIVDHAGCPQAEALNVAREYQRNGERYAFFKWAAQAFANLQVVPPGNGIIHQVHLEWLARLVATDEAAGTGPLIAPEFVLGCDSHTPMVNGLGVLAWGAGGIEVEAAMMGEPHEVRIPRVVGVRLRNRLPPGATITDLVLTVTERLRAHGVVGAFVEFCGAGVDTLSVPDRATLANMAPEYGATTGFFPIDARTLAYLRQSGRPADHIALIEAHARRTGLFAADKAQEPMFQDVVEIDLAATEPSLAGPKRPQDRVALTAIKQGFRDALAAPVAGGGFGRTQAQLGASARVARDGGGFDLGHGAVLIAAITSCTNTSNPSVMLGAGLLARNAVARGLRSAPWVKTSLAPGSRLVQRYLEDAGLTAPLQALGFDIVGFGCTTCSGKSGPLAPEIEAAVSRADLVGVAVLSGNRNFEGRVHKCCRASYLASPPLVVAFAIAGRIDIDFETEPLGFDQRGAAVFLRDIWPDAGELETLVRESQQPAAFRASYATLFEGSRPWRRLNAPSGPFFPWDEGSTYIRRPPFFELPAGELADRIEGARALAVFGDSLTTDHITPSGEILPDSQAGRYLIAAGVAPRDFNAVTQRRGNHEFMARVTFANQRLKNRLVEGIEGGYTRLAPGGEVLSIYDAAQHYAASGTPVIVLAGRDYGMGSSRDWAAKGPRLLGIRAVLARSFERIHRANLIGMGILPLTFARGDSVDSLGLSGFERFTFTGLRAALETGAPVAALAARPDGTACRFSVLLDVAGERERALLAAGGLFPRLLAALHGRERTNESHGVGS